ncbi:ATP-binding protein [Streptosporangium soli]|nr:ATP-binding protein [Streptosporangium sp. KLBMP 9127]
MSTGNRKGAERMEKALKTRMVFAGHPYTREPTSCVLGEKRIPRETAAVASLRRFVHDIAADWKAAEDIPETAALLVSELATNALTHGSSDAPTTSTIHVTVTRERSTLRVAVHDSSTAIPRIRRLNYLAQSGRGLTIVQTLADNWGWTFTPSGKTVWFTLLAWTLKDKCISRSTADSLTVRLLGETGSTEVDNSGRSQIDRSD